MNPDTVFVWNKVGELPVSAAYGVSVSCSDGIICIGGTDGQDALTSVYKIRWDEKSEKNGKIRRKEKSSSKHYRLYLMLWIICVGR